MTAIAGMLDQSLNLRGPLLQRYGEVLAPEALRFVAGLAAEFRPRVYELLERRRARQARLDTGETLDFLAETGRVRAKAWQVAPPPKDLADRRVEITGPPERKMAINAMNSGASVYMADFEDSCSPTWDNLVGGQINLADLVRGTIEHTDPETGKRYALAERTAVLFVRPRGWHLPEAHLELDGEPVPAALFDFGLFFFHNARALLDRGRRPYFYLPKLESHLEARLWNDVFAAAQEALDIPPGAIRATVLIETLPAAFEMEEILWELRDHSAGLNCGRWDYIFSTIKTHRASPDRVLPDRAQVTMAAPFMRAYTQLLVRTCHARGAHAMGGMAAQIPIKGDPEASQQALDKVRRDKEREVGDGHDGTWVAHPGLVPVAREVFDRGMPGPNQIHRRREDVQVAAADLLAPPEGTRTEAGLRTNVRVGVQYLAAWLAGRGCVPLYHLMEDAATAEICRTQVWQQVRHGAALEDGRAVTRELVEQVLADELSALADPQLKEAGEIFQPLVTAPECADFLTGAAYSRLVAPLHPKEA